MFLVPVGTQGLGKYEASVRQVSPNSAVLFGYVTRRRVRSVCALSMFAGPVDTASMGISDMIKFSGISL